jgi:hypothetical protein
MTLTELITDLKAAGANENTLRLALNCYELGVKNATKLYSIGVDMTTDGAHVVGAHRNSDGSITIFHSQFYPTPTQDEAKVIQ